MEWIDKQLESEVQMEIEKWKLILKTTVIFIIKIK
jgi:hypothetical protein